MSRTMLVYHYPKCRTFELAGDFPNGKGAWWFSNVLGFWLTLAAYVAGVFLSLVVTGGSSWTVLAVVREQLMCIYVYVDIYIYMFYNIFYTLYTMYYVQCTLYYILCTVYNVLCIIYYLLYTMYFTQYALHYKSKSQRPRGRKVSIPSFDT